MYPPPDVCSLSFVLQATPTWFSVATFQHVPWFCTQGLIETWPSPTPWLQTFVTLGIVVLVVVANRHLATVRFVWRSFQRMFTVRTYRQPCSFTRPSSRYNQILTCNRFKHRQWSGHLFKWFWIDSSRSKIFYIRFFPLFLCQLDFFKSLLWVKELSYVSLKSFSFIFCKLVIGHRFYLRFAQNFLSCSLMSIFICWRLMFISFRREFF